MAGSGGCDSGIKSGMLVLTEGAKLGLRMPDLGCECYALRVFSLGRI